MLQSFDNDPLVMLESWFNTPKNTVPTVTRTPAGQAGVDADTATMALYHYDSCMYCARVRKAIGALGLNIELRDIMHERERYRELATLGGRTTVPCLKIGKNDDDGQWMYESADIIAYLVKRFGASS